MASTTQSSGIGFPALLGIVFITLKFCHVIDWSWCWVLAPFWIGMVIMLAIVMSCILFAFLVSR